MKAIPETPSLVILGDPQDFSMITVLPFGPMVVSTASARMLTPANISDLAAPPKTKSLAERRLKTALIPDNPDRNILKNEKFKHLQRNSCF